MNQPPYSLLPWLTHVESLTEKLKTIAGEALLCVLSHEWGPLNAWDNQVLAVQGDDAIHREILMQSQGTACWYARTVIPRATYDADHVLFDRLKQEPLGALLFQGTTITRSWLKTYSIDKHSMEFEWVSDYRDNADELWVRLSEFILHDQRPFYLLEILLPGLERFC